MLNRATGDTVPPRAGPWLNWLEVTGRNRLVPGSSPAVPTTQSAVAESFLTHSEKAVFPAAFRVSALSQRVGVRPFPAKMTLCL